MGMGLVEKIRLAATQDVTFLRIDAKTKNIDGTGRDYLNVFFNVFDNSDITSSATMAVPFSAATSTTLS